MTISTQMLSFAARRGRRYFVTLQRKWQSTAAAAAAADTLSKVHIHFATSTGTAQLFAHELQNALLERPQEAIQDIQVLDIGKTKSLQQLDPSALHLFLVSTTGVGEFPRSAQALVESLGGSKDENGAASNIRFGVFGLGNSAAHPHHYNVASKELHDKLVALKAQPWLPLMLGDDGDCIEEDYDQWQAMVLDKLSSSSSENGGNGMDEELPPTESIQTVENVDSSKSMNNNSTMQSMPKTSDALALPAFGKRLQLVKAQPSAEETTRTDLYDVMPEFYHPDVQRWKVTSHVSLSPQPTANALHELQLQLSNNPNHNTEGGSVLEYSAGDHLVVYPSQSDYLVEAYLDHWNIDVATALHSTLEPKVCPESSSYPHPTGISLYDTLRHCVDLLAPPPPRVARTLFGRDDIDYKKEVATPRQSPLALLKQSGRTDVTLEDLLHQLPSVSPRYYSIASSASVHPHTIYLTYRPVRFLNTLGSLQQGLCTSYFSTLQTGSTVIAYINKNPTFRLPDDASVPVILLAGGCGVAAVRSLAEELQSRERPNPAYIFLGFRNPADAAYVDVMESIHPELLDVSYSLFCTDTNARCALVSDRVLAHGELLYDLLNNQGAHVYLCGGARTFGAAIQRELYNVYAAHHGAEDAQAELQALIDQGRYCEDLAD